MNDQHAVILTICAHFPVIQGIYLFGSHGTADQRQDSDIDIALLLPPLQAKQVSPDQLNRCSLALSKQLQARVDLVNARRVSTVMQKEIIAAGRLLHVADRYAVEEFEMLTLSYLQKLNDERAGILQAFAATGRAYAI